LLALRNTGPGVDTAPVLRALHERAAREKLSAKDIKASIRSWRPDPFRT